MARDQRARGDGESSWPCNDCRARRPPSGTRGERSRPQRGYDQMLPLSEAVAQERSLTCSSSSLSVVVSVAMLYRLQSGVRPPWMPAATRLLSAGSRINRASPIPEGGCPCPAAAQHALRTAQNWSQDDVHEVPWSRDATMKKAADEAKSGQCLRPETRCPGCPAPARTGRGPAPGQSGHGKPSVGLGRLYSSARTRGRSARSSRWMSSSAPTPWPRMRHWRWAYAGAMARSRTAQSKLSRV